MSTTLILLIGILFALLAPHYQLPSITDHLTPQQSSPQESGELLQARELTNAAVKLYNERKFKQALDPAKRALQIREKVLPADDKRVLDAVGNLAAIHLALSNHKQAETYYRRILASQEKRFGAENLQVAKTLDVLGWLHYVRGDVKQSEAEYKRVLAIKEKVSGPNSVEVARTLFRLAEIHQTQGALEEAEPYYRRLIEFDDELPLEADITVSDARHSFVCLLRKMNRTDEADKVQYRDGGKFDPTMEAAPPQGFTVREGGVLNGKALRLQKPDYPAQARSAGISGTVAVTVTINEQGKVVRACAVNGHPMLWLACERAAYASEFAPTTLEGKPVRVTGVITYNFVRL